MNLALKIAIYLVLIIAAIFFANRFYSLYRPDKPGRPGSSEQPSGEKTDSGKAETNTTASTNPGTATSVTATNLPTSATNTAVVVLSATNQPGVVATNLPVAATDTNRPASTNAPTNAVAGAVSNPPPPAVTNESATIYTASGSTYQKTPGKSSMASIISYFGALVAVLIFLGVMIARDMTNLFASRTVEFLFQDEGEGFKSPEYEEAEAVWANGEALEAIQLMREYLKKNPREQYVALRIAEIYEKDLKNDLAAALEYEEILKKKLTPERWGWAAIHLCNIYSRNGRTAEAVELLRRIDQEHPKIAAAAKARKRLAMYESGDLNALSADDTSGAPETAAAPAPEPAEVPPVTESGMPPGFRPKS